MLQAERAAQLKQARVVVCPEISVFPICQHGWQAAVAIHDRKNNDPALGHLPAPCCAQLVPNPFGRECVRREHKRKIIVFLHALHDPPRERFADVDGPFVKPDIDTDLDEILRQLFYKRFIDAAVTEK